MQDSLQGPDQQRKGHGGDVVIIGEPRSLDWTLLPTGRQTATGPTSNTSVNRPWNEPTCITDGQNLRVLKSMTMSFDFLFLLSLSHTRTQMRKAKVLRVEWFARGGSDRSLGCRLQHWVLLSGVELIKRCRSGPESDPETREGEVLRPQPPSGSD